MSKYLPTIGLEIHAELATKTKMFCRSKNDPNESRPNINICPICLAHPGTLPMINKEAVKQVLRLGLAVGGELASVTEFDRKNYFYPDIPKGYQISQYERPLVKGGELAGVKITRVHLEEDTARSIHSSDNKESLIDFNRAGVPLMELVTEPVITSGEQAANFAKELQLVLRYLGAGEANLEKGEMRVEANISVAVAPEVFLKTDREGNLTETISPAALGTKVEVKNLNSFRSVAKAIDYELKRQEELLESGGKVEQETRGWDEAKQVTFSQREKESSHDYRYFPDPDLPPLDISKIAEFADLAKTIPELPGQKRERLQKLGFLQVQDIEQLVGDAELSELFAGVEKTLADPALIKITVNFILNDVVGNKRKNPTWPLPSAAFLSEVAQKYHSGVMSSPQAKQAIVTGEMVAAVDDSVLPALVERVVASNPTVVADYKAGKEAALQYLVGQGMKESKGSANPAVLAKLIKQSLL